MTTFLLDLWQDLRAKRLWPVAVVLLAATVAVPVMLFKPASSTPPPTTAATASKDGKLPSVTLDASSVSGSHLDVFKQKNPFTALDDPIKVADAAGAGSPIGDSIGKAAAGGDSSPAGGASTGTGLGGGGITPPGGSGQPAPKGPDGHPIEPGVHYFTYTADVLFGARGHTQAYDGLSELDLLPDGKSPVVAFMGVRSGKTAMFFIADPAFRADGEGSCSPSPDNCMFLSLKKDEDHNEETLSAQNGQVEFVLTLTGLHVKTLSEDKAVGDTTPAKSSKRRPKRRKTLLAMPAARLAVR